MAIADHASVSSGDTPCSSDNGANGVSYCFQNVIDDSFDKLPSPALHTNFAKVSQLRDRFVNWSPISSITNDVIASENMAHREPSSSRKTTSCATSPPRSSGFSRDQLSRRDKHLNQEPSHRISYLNSDVAREVIEMGFNSESVRNVIYLRLVETGMKYTSVSELVDSVLAYEISLADVEVDSQSHDIEDASSPLQPLGNGNEQQSNNRKMNFDELDNSTPTVVGPSGAKPKRSKRTKRKKKVVNVDSANVTERAAEPAQPFSRETHQFFGGDVAPSWLLEENRRLKSARKCKICQEANINVVFIPCGHFICCDGCSSLLSKCTVCAKKIRSSNKVFIP